MPPRKKTVAAVPETPPKEAPVVVFLKVPKEEDEDIGEPVGTSGGEFTEFPKQEYSDILKQEFGTDKRFDDSVVVQLLEKVHQKTEYPENAACFWCCHGFQWRSFIVPVAYDMYTRLYTAEGNFCSPECALASIQADGRLTDTQRWNRMSLLRSLYHPLYPENRDIQPSPDKRSLRLFGGPLDIEQYRSFVWSSQHATTLALPPIRLYMPSMNTQPTTRDVKKFVQLSHDIVEKASSELRLKRSKPVHGNVLTLDRLIKA